MREKFFWVGLVFVLLFAAFRVAIFYDVRFSPRPSYDEYVQQHGTAMYKSVYQDGSIEGYWPVGNGNLRKVFFRNGILVSERTYTKEQLWRQQSTVKRFHATKSNDEDVTFLDPSIDRLEKQ